MRKKANDQHLCIEYRAALLSLCLLINTVNAVLLDVLIKLNLLTTGLLLSVKLGSETLATMGLKGANIFIEVMLLLSGDDVIEENLIIIIQLLAGLGGCLLPCKYD
ncbi:hypothetical protein pipiens_014503 [Culex pipiens pipiens]|uniref:Uncharacterized protein n=1 Tax=Culex pipiens pipiens TaxID=38569 RepID=A0ABD1CUW3_CULPP